MNRVDIPFAYFGGKAFLASKIIPFFPKHKVYVEPFCGCCNVLLQKDKSEVEVVSDIDSNIINFFRCIQDKEKLEKMLYWLENSIHHRGEYFELVQKIKTEEVDWLRAAYWFYILRYSFSGKWGQSWGYSLTKDRLLFDRFQNAYPKLKGVADRIQSAIFENRSWEFMIQNYDSENTFFYCDPPYVLETRKGEGYQNEMSSKDHKRLIQSLLNIKGSCVISGYNHPIYEELENNGWKREDFIHQCASKGIVKGRELKEGRAASRIESIWICPKSQLNQNQIGLFL